MEAHPMKGAGECPPLRIFEPKRNVETLLAPLLVRGEVVVFFHPVGFKSDDIARNSLTAELVGFVKDVAGAHFPLIADECEAIRPARKQCGAAREARVIV